MQKKFTYSVKGRADFMARIKENALTGIVLHIDGEEFHSHIPGEFNAWNLLAVYGTGKLLGFSKSELLTAMSALHTVEGRFDVIYSPIQQLTGVIDYAHTPDAVEKLLTTVKSMIRSNQHIISVVGCGGDRDKSKRPVMAKTAASLSDKSILTSDNPRSEDPQVIISEMEAGLTNELRKKSLSIIDRKEAIKTAVMLAQKGDVICIAGKGHEKYQEIKGVKYPFDDKQVLSETFKTLSE